MQLFILSVGTMARRLLIIKIAFLLFAHVFIRAQDWNCTEGHINIALIYDCQYNLQFQHNFFTLFLYTFTPFKWISEQYKSATKQFSFNLFLMTYCSMEMVRLETLSQKNFTVKNFNDSLLKINTSSCPQHLLIENVLHETREVFNDASNLQRKLALFVSDQNKTHEKYNNKLSRWLENKKSLNDNIKLFFILINPKVGHEETNLNSITINTLENPRDIVTRSIDLICNKCNTLYKGYKHNHQCYFVLTGDDFDIKREEASEICGKKFYKSQLVSMNTKSEHHYVASILKTEIEKFIISDEDCLDWSLKHCKCIPSNDNARKKRGLNKNIDCATNGGETNYEKREITIFLGLMFRWKNYSDELIWDDGSPFVLDIKSSAPNYGSDCIYWSQMYKIDYSSGSITLDKLQMFHYDCNIFLKTNIILCESQMSDKKIKRITIHDLQQKVHATNDQVLYESVSLFLASQMGYEQNEVISIRNHTFSYIVYELEHMPLCNEIDEMLVTNIYNKSLSLNLAISDLCDSNEIQYCTSYQLICQKIRDKEIFSIIYNESQHTFKQLNVPNLTDTKCLYEIGSGLIRVGQSNNKDIQNCEIFNCPAGFVKCPDSYCIPAYLVDDGTKDCPHGEDENVVNAETSQCQGKLKFTLKNLCLPKIFCEGKKYCRNYMDMFVCQIQCSSGYFCMSNIIRKDDDYNITFKVRVLETTSQLYNDINTFYFTPQIYFLFHVFNIVEIYLSKCMIINLEDVIGNIDNSDVINLDVSYNDLSSKYNFSVLEKMKHLQKLNISYNPILKLDENFIFPSNIKAIDLSYTKCGNGVIKRLVNLTHLRNLEMRHVEPIDFSKVSGNVKLDILDVRGTEIVNIKGSYLSWLTIDKALYTDDFRLCCDVIRGRHISEETCHAPRDAISTCQDLIGDSLKRVILWVVGVLSLLGNIVVVIYRLLWDRAVFKTAYGLFVVCLGVSDFIMGVYLLIVAGADMLYRNLYVLNDMYWRHSNMCQLAGILSTFSSETSTMFICLITLDRYLVIRYPFGEHRFSKSGKITSICLTLVIGVVVSVIPALFPGWEIYSTNGMCLALPFSSGKHMGWEYSAALFVGLNFVLFIIIAIGQIAIFLAISYNDKNSSSQRDNLRRAQDFAVARQLFLVAMSDLCCWFPIGIMGIMSLNGYHFNPEVYAWSAVLILPVNSAINPLIYTFPVILRKMRSNDVMSRMSSR